jgi:hypothetical protein
LMLECFALIRKFSSIDLSKEYLHLLLIHVSTVVRIVGFEEHLSYDEKKGKL